VEFSTCLNELKNETHNGFTEQEVEILIDALVSIKNLGKLFSYCTFSETCFEKKNNFKIIGHFSTHCWLTSCERCGQPVFSFQLALPFSETGSFLTISVVLGRSWKWYPSVAEVLNCSEILPSHQHVVALFLCVSLFNERIHFNYWYAGAGRLSFIYQLYILIIDMQAGRLSFQVV
jgi:hypothetical protein